jgi:hypothetical protein
MRLTLDHVMDEGVRLTGPCLVRLRACLARGFKCRLIAQDRHAKADSRRQEARSVRSFHDIHAGFEHEEA